MARITIRLPDDLDSAVEDTLEYGESKSEFYRQAAEILLALLFPTDLDEQVEETLGDDETKGEFLREAVEEKLARVDQSNDPLTHS